MINDPTNTPTNYPLTSGNSGLTDLQEKQLLNYLDALRRGDLEAQNTILLAVNDPAFEEAVWEAQVAFGAELLQADAAADRAAAPAEAERLRDLIAVTLGRHVAPTAREIMEEQRRREEADRLALAAEAELPEALEPPVLTLRDVAIRLRKNVSDGIIAARDRSAAGAAATRIEQVAPSEPIKEDYLTPRGARTLLARLGLSGAGAWLDRLFHDAVIDLTQAREQEVFRLAAARRARQTPKAKAPASQEDRQANPSSSPQAQTNSEEEPGETR